MKRYVFGIVLILLTACANKAESSEKEKEKKINVIRVEYNDKNDAESVSDDEDEEGVFISYTIDEASVADFEKARENLRSEFISDTLDILKVNGIVKLPVESREIGNVFFIDTLLHTDDELVREYNYCGQFKTTGYYLVEGFFWEHSEYYLINKSTGSQTVIWNLPQESPDKKFFANLSLPYGIEYSSNGIQFWKIETEPSSKSTSRISLFLQIIQLD